MTGPRPETPAGVTAFRKRFPIFRSKIHLASNSMGAVSDAMITAQAELMAERLEYGTIWPRIIPRHERLREVFAQLMGVDTTEIAACGSATQAMGMMMSSLDWTARPGLVFDAYSFPSMTYLCRAQERRGAQPRMVPAGADGIIRPEDFDAYLTPDVQLVCVSSVCYKNGHRLDIKALAERVHAMGALLAVDDYQCCGTRPMDLHAMGVDVLVTGTAKYLLGTPGMGLMYVSAAALEKLHPTLTGWFGQADMNAFQIDSHDEAPDARRFQTGTPAIGTVYESLAGAELLLETGLGHIGEWVQTVTGYAIDRLAGAGHTVITPRDDARRGPQVTIAVPDGPAAVKALAERGIICSSRDGKIRSAWHYYNTPEDAEALVAALDSLPR